MGTMTGRRIGLGAVGLGIAVVLIATFASRRVLLEEWYISKLRSTDEETRKNAAKALVEYGSERSILPLMEANSDSLNYILQERGKPDALVSMEKNFARTRDQQRKLTRRLLPDKQEGENLWTREKRTAVDKRVADLLREMETMLTIDPFFESLTRITEREKKSAVPYLSEELENDNWHVRWLAVRLLGALGSDAEDSVSGLKSKLEDSNSFVRYAAAEARWSIGRYYEQ